MNRRAICFLAGHRWKIVGRNVERMNAGPVVLCLRCGRVRDYFSALTPDQRRAHFKVLRRMRRIAAKRGLTLRP